MQPIVRARLATLALALLAGACNPAIQPETREPAPSSTATASATSALTGSPAPSTPAAQSPSAPPLTPSPSTSPSTAPPPPTAVPSAAPAKLVIDWINPPGASGLDGLYDIRGSARVNNRFVIVGGISGIGDDGEETLMPAIWWSDTGTLWQLAELPDGYVLGFLGCCMSDVVAGGPGFVAVGEGLPLWSADGKTWLAGAGDALGETGRLDRTGVGPGGLIAVGYDFESDKPLARQSTDGRTWTAADTVAGIVGDSTVTFVSNSQGLTAFVARSTTATGQTAIYRVTSPTSWQAAGTVNDYITRAAWGPHGWLAVGDGVMWLSPDLTNWTRAPTAPVGSVEALIDDQAGYVAMAAIYPAGCVISLTDVRARTWTSLDGRNWQRTGVRWVGRWLSAFFLLNRTLIGVGQIHETTDFGYVRTASLPTVAAVAGPVPTPQPTPTPATGC